MPGEMGQAGRKNIECGARFERDQRLERLELCECLTTGFDANGRSFRKIIEIATFDAGDDSDERVYLAKKVRSWKSAPAICGHPAMSNGADQDSRRDSEFRRNSVQSLHAVDTQRIFPKKLLLRLFIEPEFMNLASSPFKINDRKICPEQNFVLAPTVDKVNKLALPVLGRISVGTRVSKFSQL